MKKFLLPAALLTIAATTFAVTPKRLASFTETENYSTDVTTISYDADGRIDKVSDEYSDVTIDYSGLANGKIVVDYSDKYGYYTSVCNVDINDSGLATKAVESDRFGESTTWEFSYTGGQLTQVVIKDGPDIEYIDIVWKDGSIAEYAESEAGDRDVSTYSFYYSGIANTGRLALLDDIYGIDLDDLEYLAMGGFLGATPSQLPTGIVEKDNDGTERSTVNWELDTEGYPIRVSSPQERGDSTTFSWEADNSGVATVGSDLSGPSKFYTIDGREIANPGRGIVIERKADGSTVKSIR